ncbi:MAG: RHS repeat-associated core domain-containing protein, partial [Methyloversatilis sp.]|uniref:RHS repeat-associated core domain-containing protein n=1 Tax=Methyloversatilis sp. TaxID=2569862 RepID=UPI002735646A
MAETSDTGVPIRSYAWADENLISQVEYAPNATSTGYDIARILYFELDQLGTPRQARERVGTIVWRWESDGYGTSAANEDPDGNGQPTTVNLRFPGQYYDEESGLHYNWHRYYVPRLGRYLSSDPIGLAGGINTYSYVEGNPLRFIDPLGLMGNNPRATTPGYSNLPSGPVANVSLGAGGAGAFGMVFSSADSGVAFDTKGHVCFYSNVCGGAGVNFPLSGTLAPIVVGVGGGELCSGSYDTKGVYWYGGAGLGGEGNVQASSDGSLSFSRGGIGMTASPAGESVGAGIAQCRLTLICND